ncbi:Retrovirus-related pol polyprotein, partial [Thalictrum thalictroides]
MSNLKQRSDEDVRSFAGRTEKCFHELVGALTVGLEPGTAAAVAASYKTGALTAFVNGTRHEIRALLKARDVPSLEKAISIAVEEEQDLQHINRRFNTNKNYGKNNANKKNIKCNKCSKMGHYANECRSNTGTSYSTNFRNPISSRDDKTSVVKHEYQGQ